MTAPSNLERLVDNHRRFLAFVQRRVANPADAEEILQAAFVKGVEKQDTVADGESIVAWFYRVLRNAVIDYYRHRDAARRALEREAQLGFDAAQPPPEIAEAVCGCFHGLLPLLNDDYAHLLRRVDLEGVSIADVADELGITENNTRVRLHRARAALRKQLQRSCGTCATHGCLDCTCGSAAGHH